MRPNPLAPWELRVGDMRVYYEVDEGTPASVSVVAVGVKTGNTLRIGGEVVQI